MSSLPLCSPTTARSVCLSLRLALSLSLARARTSDRPAFAAVAPVCCGCVHPLSSLIASPWHATRSPEYVKMVPHADMTELIIQTDPSQLDFWKTSASAWGATKFIVAAAK